MTLDPQAAAELSQELTLVTRALFAQLLPTTAAHAVAGIGRPDQPAAAQHAVGMHDSTPAPVAQPLPQVETPVESSVPPAITLPTTEAPTNTAAPAAPTPPAPAALPVPSAVPAPLPVDAPAAAPVREPASEPASEPVPVGGLPVPSLALPGLPVPDLDVPESDTQVHPVPAEALRPSRRGTAVLEEIAFLDE